MPARSGGRRASVVNHSQRRQPDQRLALSICATPRAPPGFDVELLKTEPIAKFAGHLPMRQFPEEHGFNTAYRGEQIYGIAVKNPNLPITRYPKFLYVE